MPASRLWRTARLDGQIYGEPLIYGSRAYVVTENDSVYALRAATGAVIWRRNVGVPVPDFLTTAHNCGNIGGVGITSTPVIDPVTKRIYAVGDTWDGRHRASIQHLLVGFTLGNGAPVRGFPRVVDPPGSNRPYQLQRAALALDHGKVIIGFGGDVGDCNVYHGWLVAAPESGRGKLRFFEAAPQARGGSIWGGGDGPVVDPSGNIWVATANGFRPFYDGQDSVLKLTLGAGLHVVDHWTPANWPTLDAQDFDLGSSEPLFLPGGLVFQIGKAGEGYLLSASHLGGTGAPPVFAGHVCNGAAFGGPVYAAGVIYVPCFDGLRALALGVQTSSFVPLQSWHVTPGAVGPPIVAAGLVWSAGWTNGILYGLDPTTGAPRFQVNLGSFDHFATPSAADGRLFVANADRVTAFRIATPS